MSESFPCSLVLAAHGSLAYENCNQPIFELADRVAATGIFSVVTPAFLNGQPQLNNVFELLPPGDTVVVPLMTSEGYYSKTKLPEKLAENKLSDKNRIFVTPALGVQPQLAQLVANRVVTIMTLCQLQPADTTIVLIGHGTRRHPDSGNSTHELAAGLQSLVPELLLKVAFLDQEPAIDTVVRSMTTPHRLVVPFLISRGPHATIDVPQAVGLPTGPEIEFPIVDNTGDRITICDLPVGMYPEISDVCLELATDQLMDGAPVELINSLKEGPA